MHAIDLKLHSPLYLLTSPFSHENGMTKISRYNTFYFLRYKHVRYLRCFFTNIQKHLGNLETSRIKNLRIRRIKNAKFSEYCLYMNTDI